MGRGAQAQSRGVRMSKNMSGNAPRACLAPLPYTLSKTSNVVFGHDSLRCDRQALKRRTMVKERANRTGNEDLATLRRALDGDEEGCPVAVIEAQLCGLPVISTLHGGIPDVVLDGETGILVEEGDIFAMASAMAELFDNPSLAAQLGTAGQLRARKNFTLDCHINQISSLISSLTLTFFLCCPPSMTF